MIIGYAGCSTDEQDLTAQRQQLEALGAEHICTDHGLTGKNRAIVDELAGKKVVRSLGGTVHDPTVYRAAQRSVAAVPKRESESPII